MSNSNYPKVPDVILKKLILLYGFNLELKEKTKRDLKQFKEPEYETYYLINYEWLTNYKIYYNYKLLEEKFKQNSNFTCRNYSNFVTNLDTLSNNIKSCNICQNGFSFPNELKEGFFPNQRKIENISYFEDFFIINKDIEQKLSHDEINNYKFYNNCFYGEFFVCKNTFFINNNNQDLEIGKINNGIFIPQYHIKFNEKDIIKDVIKEITKNGIDNYFKNNKINVQSEKVENFNKGFFINCEKYKDYIKNKSKQNTNIQENNFKETKIINSDEAHNLEQNLNDGYTMNLVKKNIIPCLYQQENDNKNEPQNNPNNNFNGSLNQQINVNSNKDFDKFPKINQVNQQYPNNSIQNQKFPNINNNPQMIQNINNNPQMIQNINNNPQMFQNINNNPQMIPNINNNFQIFQNINNNPQMIPNINNNFQIFQNININPQMLQNINNKYKMTNNTNNNPQNKPENNFSKDSFYNSGLTSLKQLNYIPLIGLKNIGQTCYMNSVLQCMSNLYHITNYFLNPTKKNIIYSNTVTMPNKNAPSLSIAYKELIDNLWKGKPKIPYAPHNFKDILGKLNPLFKDQKAGDSKDLIVFLLMQLHEELNNIDPNINKNSNKFISQENITVNPYDKCQVFQFFINDFLLKHSSLITRYFYGINQNMFECQNCKMNNIKRGVNQLLIKYNYENFFYLEFPLEKVRNFVMMQNNNNNIGMNFPMNYQNLGQVNIYQCFYYFQSQNEISGYCDKCGLDEAKLLNNTKIYSSPVILILIFNRGKGLQFNIKINFPEILDLSQVILNENKEKIIYELQSVVKHLGDNSSSGHFIAYCRSPIPNFHNCWFCYNDETVVQTNNWNDIHDIGNTYILFYQLKQ